MKKYTTVLFDMDGVLINSEPVYINRLKQFFNLNNIAYKDDEFNYIVGNTPKNYDDFVKSTWARSRDIKEYLKAQREFYKLYGEIDYKKILFPNVLSTIKSLADNNFILGLASSSPSKDVESMLNQTGLAKYLCNYLTSDDVIETKPNPQIYIDLMKKLSVNSESVLIVEDSYFGIMAGKNAGADVAAISCKDFMQDQSFADYIIKDISEILKLI